ncbi:hypothetical protein [Roseomonas chloroacetimidivorans]|uniref:hypothetical protein n=1 Tax=Roseomonas chloroacetimidivorans TaxID=1766656 RepID=UPI003C791F7F
MLNLRPSQPEPVTAEKGRAELVSIWDGLDQEGRRMLLANARAVGEVTGHAPAPADNDPKGPSRRPGPA